MRGRLEDTLLGGRRDATERIFLMSVLLGRDRGRGNLRRLAGDLDWTRVHNLARDLGVASTLFQALRRNHLSDLVTPEVMSRLKDDHHQTHVQNLILLNDLAEMNRVLAENDIRVVALKGAALLLTAYSDNLARHMDDIDLLLETEHLETAVTILKEQGFREHVTHAVNVDGATIRHDDALRRLTNSWHPSVLLSPQDTRVELHTRESDVELPTGPSASIESKFGNVCIPQMSELLAHLCHHVYVQHGSSPCFRLRHLCDTAKLVDSGSIDRESVKMLKQRFAPVRETFQTLDLIQRSIEQMERRKLALLSRQIVRRHTARLVSGTVELLQSFRRGPRAAFRLVFPTRSYLASTYQVPADRLSTYLYHLYRLSGVEPPHKKPR